MKKRLLIIATAIVMLICLCTTAFAYNKGDVDNDGKVNVGDARLCLRQAIKLDSCTDGDDVFKACDVDRDGKITVGDARLILRVAISLDPKFVEDAPVDEPTTVPEETTKAPEETTTKTPEETTTAHSQHTWDAGTVTTQPTCANAGVKTFKCTVCGETKTESIAATGNHSYDAGKVTVNATCTSTGVLVKTCTVCKATKNETIPQDKNAHDYKAVTVAATCTDEGYTGKKCSRCGDTVKESTLPVDENAHKFIPSISRPTCLGDGYTVNQCEYCQSIDASTYVAGDPALGHDYKTETTPATCTEPAKIVKTCSREDCGAIDITEDEANPALGHAYKYTTTKAATCTSEGSRNGECSRCGDKVTEVVPMVAHTVNQTKVRGSKTGDNCHIEYICSVCKNVFRTVENSGHEMRVSNTAAATCTTPTTYSRACRYCSYTDVIDNDDALGHATTIAASKNATCTDDGYVIYSGSCTRCGEVFGNEEITVDGNTYTGKFVTINAKGHKIADGDVADCEHSVICSRCRTVVEPAYGHDYSIKATGLGSNAQYFFCNNCGALRNDALAAFNLDVNLIKQNSYISASKNKMTWFGRQSMTTTYTKFDFGTYTNIVKDLYEEEMQGETVEFTPLYEDDTRYYNLPIRYKAQVSKLTDADVDGVKVERITGLTANQILASYDSTFTVGKTTYDISKYKTDAVICDNVVKVTVDIKDEILKKSGGTVDWQNPNVETSMEKIFAYDVRDELSEYNDWVLEEKEGSSSEGYEISMTMALNSVKTNGTVVYYFNADTMEPLAAVYNIERVLDQTVNMKFAIGIMNIKGVIQPLITTTDNYVYLFPTNFKG